MFGGRGKGVYNKAKIGDKKHLMKERTGATNREIGEVFLGLSNSAVGKVYQRFKKEINENRKLLRKVTTIKKTLSFIGFTRLGWGLSRLRRS